MFKHVLVSVQTSLSKTILVVLSQYLMGLGAENTVVNGYMYVCRTERDQHESERGMLQLAMCSEVLYSAVLGQLWGVG